MFPLPCALFAEYRRRFGIVQWENSIFPFASALTFRYICYAIYNTMNEEQRIMQLRELLHRYNHEYYVMNAPTVSDREFDALMHELIDLENRNPEFFDENSPTQRVGSDLNHEFVQVAHRYPMLSLANTYNREEVEAFYRRVEAGLGGRSFDICCEL